MTLIEILSSRGFDLTRSTKLVRHQDPTYDVGSLYRQGYMGFYQSCQSKPIFDNCEYVISFIGLENSKAMFFGVYVKNGVKKFGDTVSPEGFPYPNMFSADDYMYMLSEIPGYDDLKERLIIDWGLATRSWVQWLKNEKEVIEILPRGYLADFPGFLEFTLSYAELCKIVRYPDANREWHKMLRSVAGIYLILDTTTGLQYIGSAYGEHGILGRWNSYAESGHGGNILLEEVLRSNPERIQQFQYTILQTLPKTLTNAEVIRYESIYKKKLGTRSFGLNAN